MRLPHKTQTKVYIVQPKTRSFGSMAHSASSEAQEKNKISGFTFFLPIVYKTVLYVLALVYCTLKIIDRECPPSRTQSNIGTKETTLERADF